MGFSLKGLVLKAFQYWNCPIVEVDSNIFNVEIEEGSLVEKICEANGSVHIGLENFDDDIISSFNVWRSFVKGSYYINRLLEELRIGPLIGHTSTLPMYKSPSLSSFYSIKNWNIRNSDFLEPGELYEFDAKVIILHFVINILGAEPESEFLSIAVETDKLKIISVSTNFETSNEIISNIDFPKIDSVFKTALEELSLEIKSLLNNYKNARANSTIQAIRKIRASKKDEITNISKSLDNLELEFKKREIEEIWEIREQNARLRSEPESVDINLVAATFQTRPLTLFKNKLLLPNNRTRIINRYYDRNTNWIEPLRCESCNEYSEELIPGDVSCKHIVCAKCIIEYSECLHKSCIGCRIKCKSCGKFDCPSCGIKCYKCKSFSCINHGSNCTICSGKICTTCNPKCSSCDSRYCDNHGVSCPVCSQVMCPDHLIHKDNIGHYRMSVETFQKLWLELVPKHILEELWSALCPNFSWSDFFSDILWESISSDESWDTITPVFRDFKGRKDFTDFIKSTIGENNYSKYSSIIFKHIDKCRDIWVKQILREIHSFPNDFYDFNSINNFDDFCFPFKLNENAREKIIKHPIVHPKLIISLDDKEFWQKKRNINSDPIMNEFGVLHHNNLNYSELEEIESIENFLDGWFSQDFDSNPIFNDIPFYDSGIVEHAPSIQHFTNNLYFYK